MSGAVQVPLRGLLLTLGLVAGMLFLTPSAAIACSCAQADVGQQTERADTVVTGTLQWTSDNQVERTYSVEVDDVYKGSAGSIERLTSPVEGASCGVGELATEKRYVWFIQGEHRGTMSINGCGGTTAYSAELVDQVRAVTGPPHAAIPVADLDGTTDSRKEGTSAWTVVLTGLAVVAALGGLLWFGSRKR